ncbi:MAG: SMP-30/gluconolactonase/LRE family protein [Gemmataceae bacterium]
MRIRIATALLLCLSVGLASAADEGNIIPEGAKVEKIAGDCRFTEGPAYDGDGNLLFTDSPNHRIMVVRPDGKVEVWAKNTGDANGMRFDTKGRLHACCGEGGARAVVRFDKEGKRTVIADRFEGKRLNAPNDLCFDKKGRCYFTDPCYGSKPKDGVERFAVYRIEADKGELVPNKVTRVIDDVVMPNGIYLSPDEKTLYVADNSPSKKGPHTLVAYDVADDGTCKRRAVVYDFKDHRGIDGMVVDARGNVYATAESGKLTGVYIIAPDGKQVGFIPTPETATNCTFGGPDLQTLYITAGRSAYKIKLNAQGQLVYPPAK